MNKFLTAICAVLFFSLSFATVYATEYHIPLLAVRETAEGFEGSAADLTIEINKGTGRIFIDTRPLTKLDTQISTRFANEIACAASEKICEDKDFIYTITSSSSIVGGPSAGAATALLTVVALEDLPLKEDIGITGTINSGGLIGPVGGVKEKIDASKDIGLKTVLIPKGERFAETLNKTTNETEKIDVVAYGNKIGISVVEVATLDDALYYATGKKPEIITGDIEINTDYQNTMQMLTNTLCEKSTFLKEELDTSTVPEEYQNLKEIADNLTEKHEASLQEGKFYTAASYCFGANTRYAEIILMQRNLSPTDIDALTAERIREAAGLEREIERYPINTITDLETYMIVKERIVEAKDNLAKVNDHNDTKTKIQFLSFGGERLESARSWAEFFGTPGKEFDFQEEKLKDSCEQKISEAQERLDYLTITIPFDYESTVHEIELAKKDLANKDYALCLFKASKAKANSDVILHTIGSNETQVKENAETRLDVIRQNIIKGQREGVFPVVGYSYYEYAQDLKDEEIFSSILFAEYSLELSNLEIYFTENTQSKETGYEIQWNSAATLVLLIGLAYIAGLITPRKQKQISNIKNTKKRVKTRSRKK